MNKLPTTMNDNDKFLNGIRTYVNYFGKDGVITRQGMLLFLCNIFDLSSDNVFLSLDSIKNKLCKKGYIKNIKTGQFLIIKELPLNLDYEDLLETTETNELSN